STLKPFTIAAALRTGIYNEASRIETSPGYLKVSNHIINDSSNHGTLSLSGILQKSSNVGAGKIGLAIGPEALWEIYRDVGLGESTGSGFPGESPGILSNYSNWSELDLASIAFGHGIAVTAMQLAQAYSVIAADGVLNPVTFLKTDPDDVAGKHVMSVQISQEISKMLKM
ncbi:MAG: penicillin-binding protein 2, partial [Gammaproteobacteria bacterium]|nr:penicillin-binding protein 2 [Gammaproteobacteria bacterium]NIO61286.1 penicillin-binding protein 2 [Gammaproteobacteria bacterium]